MAIPGAMTPAEEMAIPGAMTPAEEMEVKYRKAKTAAVNADDAESVAFWDNKLAQVGSVEDRRVMADDRRDPLDISLEAAKRIQRPQTVVAATEAELLGGMSDMVATDAVTMAATEASRRGREIVEQPVNRGPRAPHPVLNKVWSTLSDEQKAQTVRARNNGWTWEQIAEAIGGEN